MRVGLVEVLLSLVEEMEWCIQNKHLLLPVFLIVMDNTLVPLDKGDPAGLTKGRLEQN